MGIINEGVAMWLAPHSLKNGKAVLWPRRSKNAGLLKVMSRRNEVAPLQRTTTLDRFFLSEFSLKVALFHSWPQYPMLEY